MTSRPVQANMPHAVCIPFPAQGHVNPMTKVAKLLHFRGFHITFVHTEFNYNRLLKSRGPHALDGLPDFRFEKIPDGLPPADLDRTQDIPSLCDSTSKTCLVPFREILAKLNDTSSSHVPPVTCIVSDGVMSFTLDVAEELGVPNVLFWTASACGFLAYLHYEQLIQRGYTPFKDEACYTNEYLDTVLDWIPGMKDIQLRDIPSFIRTTNPDDIMLNYILKEVERAHRASAIIVNTFHALESNALDALSSIFNRKVYSIGPVQFLCNHIPEEVYSSIGSNLWRDDSESIFQWLNAKKEKSVVFANFGSIAVMTPNQFTEFAWGLANSSQHFLWITRPDLVMGDSAILPPEFIRETKDRGLVLSWCPQEQVLNHPSVGCFLTHCGWNSTLESICSGVPMICWPFFAEQMTNCRYTCREWGVGKEINSDVKRDEIEELVKQMMEVEKCDEMKKNALKWKKMAEDAAIPGGPSFLNFDKMVGDVLLAPLKP